MEGSAAGDQARIVTPAAAASAGATWIVLGRTVTAAGNPREALDRAHSELAAAATS
jgi:orotidine-5'-phosphate decarboxylase